MVGLNVKSGFFSPLNFWYPLGSSDFVYSFFSTVCYNLENKIWGSKYPVTMKLLYHGKVGYIKLDLLMKEILEIREELKAFSPDNVIWDIEDLSKQPPWGDEISDTITDLSNYFVTSEGEDFFEVLINAIEDAKKNRGKVIIEAI